MNILLVSRGVPSKQDPQWGSFEFDQAKALAALGHNVVIASVDTRFRFYWRKPGLTIKTVLGIKTYNLFICPEAIVSLFGHFVLDQFNRRVWHIIEQELLKNEQRFDIIYSHYLRNSHRAVNYLPNINAPVVAIEHWSEVNQPTLKPYVKRLGDETYPHVAQLINVSYAARQSVLNHWGKDSVVVYNMVNPSFTYTTCHHNSSLFRFIAVGNVLPIKGYDTLIKAFAQANLPSDKWDLRIVGHGSEQHRLNALIRSLNLQNNIHLVGQKNQSEVISLLSESDVFILASRSETFGVAYIEAMACGLPVIATRCGGPEEFVNEKNGLLVPVDDVEALAAAIKHMHEHHQNYDRQEIANNCKAHFSSQAIAKQLTEIFEDVVAKYKKSNYISL